MKRFQSPEQAQGFLSTFESLNTILRLRRHLLSAACHRRRFAHALQLWRASEFGNYFLERIDGLTFQCQNSEHALASKPERFLPHEALQGLDPERALTAG